MLHTDWMAQLSNKSPVESPFVATYPSVGRRGEMPKERLPKRKTRGSRHQCLFVENIRKSKKRSANIEKRVWELFMHGEGISTPRAHHRGWQPLIESAKCDFKIMYFSFLCLFIFWGRQGCCLAPTYPKVRWGNQTYVVLSEQSVWLSCFCLFFAKYVFIEQKVI